MGNAPWHNAAEDYEPKVDVSYTSGKHAMKFGFSYNRYTKNQQVYGDAQGVHFKGNTGYQTTQHSRVDQRRATVSWTCCWAWPVAIIRPGAADQSLCKPDAFGLRDRQLARDAAA